MVFSTINMAALCYMRYIPPTHSTLKCRLNELHFTIYENIRLSRVFKERRQFPLMPGIAAHIHRSALLKHSTLYIIEYFTHNIQIVRHVQKSSSFSFFVS